MSISDWAALPSELLHSILERLELVSDYLHFSLVCWSWNYAIESSVKANMMLRYNRHPMLLISSSTEEGENTWNAYNFIDNEVLDFQVKMPNVRFCGSSRGWLIYVEENFSVTLINPFFRIKGKREKEHSIIHLPPLATEGTKVAFWKREFTHYVYRATISADPILDADDCIVAVVHNFKKRLAFIRLGKDTQWTYIDHKWDNFREVAFVQETCYALRRLYYSNDLLSFDVATGNSSKTEQELRENFCSDPSPVRVAPKVKQNRRRLTGMEYIVDSTEGNLLMVRRGIDHGPGTRKTREFEVYELEFHTEKLRWKRKNNLGDVAIFLGDNSSFSVVASHIPGCQSNCIYFNQDYIFVRNKVEECEPHDIGVYNLEDKSFHFVQDEKSSHLSTLLKKTNRLPIWVVPTFQI